jgi:transcriptional regulator with XRE-family HTH domain
VAKYEEWLTDDGLLLIAAWARDGLTMEQIAGNMGIAASTLYKWRDEHKEISEALKKSRELVDIEVENALFRKTQGYTVQLMKAFKIKRTEYGENGRKIADIEEIVQAPDEMHVPADTTAQIFWLTNRKPDEWKRDRGAQEKGGDESGETGVVALAEVKGDA